MDEQAKDFYEDIVNTIRRFLKDGAVIRATDPNGKVLEPHDGGGSGDFFGGITISYPGSEKCPNCGEVDYERNRL